MKYFAVITFVLLWHMSARASVYDSIGRHSLSLNFNGLDITTANPFKTYTPDLQYRYYISSNEAFRLRGQAAYQNTTGTTTTGGIKTQIKHRIYFGMLAVGYQRQIALSGRWQVYMGADVGFSGENIFNETTATITDSVKAGGHNGDVNIQSSYNPFWAAVALYPFAGFQYYLGHHFALGAEFQYGMYYYLPGTLVNKYQNDAHGFPEQKNSVETASSPGFSMGPMFNTPLVQLTYYLK